MKRIFQFAVVFTLMLNACEAAVTAQPLPATVVLSTEPPLLSTATRQLPTPTKILATRLPTETTIPGPTLDSQGNISWHPEKVLIASEEGGGDGVPYDYPPQLVLMWDGTLYQRGKNYLDPPFVSRLDQDEMCKILNTVDASGLLDERNDYNFPFDGLGSQYISVNAWRSISSGSQVLSYAISGAPYYDSLFCRNCPIPAEETIIRPGLANVYFFLKDYMPENRAIAPVDKLKVYFELVDDKPTHDWPIRSITIAELAKKCDETACMDSGMILEGSVAKEIYEKIGGGEVFMVESVMNSTPFRVRYRVAWPYEPSIMYYSPAEESPWPDPPPDYTLNCSPADGHYPLLPLSKEGRFWYYAPDGKWGAEVLGEPGQSVNVRVVNKLGYEKLYQYDPALFSQPSLQVFPRFWTEDGAYFFVNILPGDFDPQGNPYVNSIGLQRISIADGKVSYLFAGVEKQGYAYTLSENGGQVVYVRQGDQPLKIVIKDTNSGKERAAALVVPANGSGIYVNAGTLVWSVDRRTIYLAATYRENGVDSGRLIAVDLSSPANQKIVHESPAAFRLNQWYLYDWYARICFPQSDLSSDCPLRLNLEEGIVEE